MDQSDATPFEDVGHEISGATEVDGGPLLTDAQRDELQRRLDEYDRNPDDLVEWEELRRELLERVARRRASAA